MIYTAPGCAARYSTSKPSRAHEPSGRPRGGARIPRFGRTACSFTRSRGHRRGNARQLQKLQVPPGRRQVLHHYSLPDAEKNGLPGVSRLPFSMKVLLENLLRYEDGRTVTKADIEAVAAWLDNRGKAEKEIAFRPARVLMQDFTGVPAVVDLAAMRDAMKNLGGDPRKINPLVPVDLVIDHSVIVDEFGTPQAFAKNVELEYERNGERYRFLKWGQTAFHNFSVVPPGTGICHQVNLEFLSQTVWSRKTEAEPTEFAYPDTLVGTDSHTTMVNGLAVLGWGVGGIEAEAAMLGQPISMLIPEVIGFKLTGKLREGVTATDLVLTVTQMLRKKGVVGKFVEFYGTGPRRHDGRRPRHHRQHGAGIRRDLRLLPDRREDDRVSCASPAGPTTASRSSRPMPRRRACSAPRTRRTRSSPTRSSSTSTTCSPRSPARSGRRTGSRSPTRRPASPRRMDTEFRKGGRGRQARHGRGRELRPRPWRRRHRGDHLVHQHLEPERHDRRRAPGPQRGREGPAHEALGQDLARAGQPGRRRVPREGRPAGRSRRARLQPRRLRLHDLHRQLRAAARAGVEGDQRQRPRRRLRCSRATATSRAASTRTCARTTSPRRRSSSPTRSPARCSSTSPRSRSAPAATASRSTSRTSGRRRRDPALHRAHHHGRAVQDALCRRVHRRQRTGRSIAVATGPHLRVGHRLDLRAEPALFRGHDQGAEAASPTSSTRASSASSSIRSRPTTSRRPATSGRPRRPASTCSSARSRSATSTSTARGAATTRS